MIFKKVIFIYFITFSIFLNANDLKKVSLQLLWKHQFEFAGFYMAKEKGFYKDVGIDVEFKEYEFGTNISKDVSEGKSDFGVDGSSLILDKIQGLDVYLLIPFLQTSPFVIMTKDRDDIKSVSDLKGKKIMITPNQVTMASLNAMFKVNNLSNKDFISQEHSFKSEDLINDKTDAISVYLSNEPYYLIEKNIKYRIFNPSEYGFNFYDNVLFTSKKLVEKDSKLVKDFYEATKKGWEYAYTHIDETIKVILKNYNTQNKSYNHLKYEADELKKMARFESNEYAKFKPEIISQINQTYNLLDISKSTVNINDFIYPDAIYKEKNVNFILLSKVLAGVLIIFGGFFYWNRKLSKLNQKIQQSQEKITLLLDNAGQGFLTFKNDFKVDSEYSKECEKLLGEDISNKDIRTLLFNDINKQIFFANTLINALNEEMQIKRNSYLSLLPSIILLNKKAVKLEYKIIDKTTFMLILTNVTTQKKLENKIKKEQEIFKMIVAIASESELFYDIVDEYERFINNKIDSSNIQELYRIIHTFKGSFAQIYMEDVVKSLHNFETILSELIKENSTDQNKLEEIIENQDLKTAYYETKKIIKEILGEEFLELNNYIKIDISNILDLQCKISNVIGDKELATPECQAILCQIQDLSKQSLYSLLKPYISLIRNLGQKFHKNIDELIIDGDRDILVKENIKPFIKSLVHVFRNSVDHGIENPDDRLLKEKDEAGTIVCKFKEKNNKLHIIISDDGMGLDSVKIKEVAINKGIDTTSLTENELYKIIFNDNFSTKTTVSEISGRGVGMSAVKNELDKLNGVIEITSQKDIGTTFEFIIPL